MCDVAFNLSSLDARGRPLARHNSSIKGNKLRACRHVCSGTGLNTLTKHLLGSITVHIMVIMALNWTTL